MEVHAIVLFFLIHSVRLSYQQDITVCHLGSQFTNGTCVPQSCPNTHVLVGGACELKPTSPVACNIGFAYINGICIQENCPSNHVLVNGVCQPKVTYPSQIPIPNLPSVYCPSGYTLYNGMCYKNTVTAPPPCQPKSCGIFNCPSTCIQIPETTTTSTIPNPILATTTTTPTVIPSDIRDCPPDSVAIEGVCRLIYCSKGTAYRGRCIEPVCSDGLVWTGRSCAKPEVITTILEIENRIITNANQTGPVFHQPQVSNKVVYHTQTYEVTTEGKRCTSTTSTTTVAPPPSTGTKCCTIITPRMCKKYGSKWFCHNRQYRRCDHVCGNNRVLYLRIPSIMEQESVLVLPPNPPLEVCADGECTKDDSIDCSGCATHQKKTCSSYCYSYWCPKNRCSFIDQSQYCTEYPGSPGCSSSDGCFQDWCSNESGCY